MQVFGSSNGKFVHLQLLVILRVRKEHKCQDPKDGEHCLNIAKSEETLVEARSACLCSCGVCACVRESASVCIFQNVSRSKKREEEREKVGFRAWV